jgi:hypothetical protein
MNKQLDLIVLVMFIFGVYCVNGVEIIEDDIGDYKLKSSTSNFDDFVPIYTTQYYNSITNNLVEVQLYEFNGSRLDKWITTYIIKANGNLNINGNIVYIGKDNKYIFWRTGQIFIRISEKHPQAVTQEVQVDSNGIENFDEDITLEYLNIYPSDCDEEECVIEKEEVLEEVYLFEEPEDLSKKARRHIGIDYICPTPNTLENIRETIGNYTQLSYSDIEKYVEQCEEYSRFLVEGIEPEGSIKDCYDYLELKLSERGLRANDYDILRECYIQDYFDYRVINNEIKVVDTTPEQMKQKRIEEFLDYIAYDSQYDLSGEEGEDDPTRFSSINKDTSDTLLNESKQYEEVEPESPEHTSKNSPSQSIFDTIKEGIKHFLKWLH